MIASTVVGQIHDLLAQGTLSQRKIARQLGVSRGTVSAIARGKRPDYAQRHRRSAADFVFPAGPVERCPGCGALVQMPCLACRIKALKRRRWLR